MLIRYLSMMFDKRLADARRRLRDLQITVDALEAEIRERISR